MNAIHALLHSVATKKGEGNNNVAFSRAQSAAACGKPAFRHMGGGAA